METRTILAASLTIAQGLCGSCSFEGNPGEGWRKVVESLIFCAILYPDDDFVH